MELRDGRLRPYVPGFAVDWLRDAPSVRHRTVTGTLAFVDVSGFTRLTERLAARGKVGAEELTDLLDGTFAVLLEVAYAHGAWLVKWGGDAVLLLFQGDGHAARGCTAAVEMRRALEHAGPLRTSSGPVRLRISTGVHSGAFDAFLVGSLHRELLLCGPGATTTAELEAAAQPGQVAVSPATAALLPPGLVHRGAGGVLLLHRSPAAQPGTPVRPEAAAPAGLTGCLAQPVVDHLLHGDDEPEHRRVAVGFVEFTGLDGLLAAHGPDAATAAVERVVRTCQESAAAHGVTFWETDIGRDGGKVMLVAGAPGSSGADEDALLAVARDVVELGGPLALRVGVTSGRVFFGQFGPPYRRTMSVKGDAVNLAARLMARAGTGEVLASTGVLDAARTAYELVPLPPFLVKGRQAPVTAAAVGRPRSRATLLQGDATPLLGRDDELALLQDEWRLAATGSLRAWELVGEPGAGTSRLVRELARTSRATVVELRGDAAGAATAHLPLRRVLRGLLGVPAGAAPEAVGEVLRDALASRAPSLVPWAPLLATVLDAAVPSTPQTDALDERFTVRRQQDATSDLLLALLPTPTLLVVDDAHLLDPSTAALLDHVVLHATQAPWLLLRCGRARDGSWPHRLDLPALSSTASTALVHALTDDDPLAAHEAQALVGRAGGNPLFLTELVLATQRGLRLDELPGSVEAVLAAGVDRLRPADRRLLRAAAVVGREVDLDVLDALALRTGGAPDGDALDRLQAFLEPAGPRAVRFRQALLREVAYEGLAYSRRSVLHGHVGDVLLERAAATGTTGTTGTADDAVLSLHFLRSQRHELAWHHARRAADRAHAASAHAEAAELQERALSAADRARPPADELARVWEALGDARSRLGQFAAAAQAYGEARRRVRGAPLDAARLHLRTAQCAERQGSYRQALRWLSTGQRLLAEVAGQVDAQRLSAELAVARATVRHWQGRHREAAGECRRAVGLAEAVGALDVVAETLVWLDVSELMLGEGDGSAARRALAILEGLGDRPWQLGRCLNETGIRAWYAGDWDAATRAYRACRASFTEAGDAWAAAQASANEAEVLSDQGRWDEAEPLLREALRASRTSQAPGFVAFVLALLGRLRARTGTEGHGLEDLRRARTSYAEIGEAAEVTDTDARIAEAVLLSGDAAAALALTTAVADAVAPVLLRVRGLALLQLGEQGQARTALEEALAAAAAAGARHEAAYALHALAGLHVATSGAVPDELAARLAAEQAALGIVRIAEPAVPAVARP